MPVSQIQDEAYRLDIMEEHTYELERYEDLEASYQRRRGTCQSDFSYHDVTDNVENMDL